jgi:hypothetical protein
VHNVVKVAGATMEEVKKVLRTTALQGWSAEPRAGVVAVGFLNRQDALSALYILRSSEMKCDLPPIRKR